MLAVVSGKAEGEKVYAESDGEIYMLEGNGAKEWLT
jgi:hypothetical protein